MDYGMPFRINAFGAHASLFVTVADSTVVFHKFLNHCFDARLLRGAANSSVLEDRALVTGGSI